MTSLTPKHNWYHEHDVCLKQIVNEWKALDLLNPRTKEAKRIKKLIKGLEQWLKEIEFHISCPN